MTIYESIASLVQYGVTNGLVQKEDTIFTTNSLLELFGLDDYEEPETPAETDLETILEEMMQYALSQGIIPE